LRLQIKDLTKIVDLLLGVFVLWPSHKKSERLPAKERAKEKMKIITAGGHEWERLNEAWRCKLCLATARWKRTMLTRTAEKRKVAGMQSLYDGLIGNGHKPFAVSFVGQADVVVCSLCGKYVQEKKKSIMQHCNKGISEAGRRVFDRVANGKLPDRLNTGRVTTCFDVAAKRPVSYSALLPAKAVKPPRRAG
jgi:hypothetical protein